MILTPGSLGDIIALTELILKILKALDETRGASAEMQAFAAYLEDFRILLHTVREQLSKTPDVAAARMLLPSILRHINTSTSILENFWRILAPYHAVKTSSKRIDALVKRPYQKLKWSFKTKGDAAVLKGRISDHHVAIQTYLIQIMAIPQTLSYTSENALVVRDFSDAKITVPWTLCSTWLGFMTFLADYHSTRPGASYVETGDFTVLDPLNSSIDASNWNLVHERSYHVTLAVNVVKIQVTPRVSICRFEGENIRNGKIHVFNTPGPTTQDPNDALALWRGKRRSRASSELASQIFKNFHFVLTKRFVVPPGDNRGNDGCRFSNLQGVFEATLFRGCRFHSGILATADSHFNGDSIRGVRLLQNTRSSFHGVRFEDCAFLNITDNQFMGCHFVNCTLNSSSDVDFDNCNTFSQSYFEDCVFLNVTGNQFESTVLRDCTFHSFSDADFIKCNTFVDVNVPNPTLILHKPNDPDFQAQLRSGAETLSTLPGPMQPEESRIGHSNPT